MQYDSMGRVIKRELKIGPYANTTQYRYEYDGDGQLVSVKVNDWSTWRYSYDLNGNLHLLNPGNSARLLPLRYDLRDRITRLGDIQYRLDEDGVLSQRGADVFEYNSNGLLERAYSRAAGGWSVRYRYDGLGRRVARRTADGEHMQFFYADLNYPTCITHLYNHSGGEITAFYYDLQVGQAGWLVSWLVIYLHFSLSLPLSLHPPIQMYKLTRSPPPPPGSPVCHGGDGWRGVLYRLRQHGHAARHLQQ